MRDGTRRAGAWLALCFALAGCADATGMVDAQGHNGYDVMTCETAKALALDIQYRAVDASTATERVSELTAQADKASDDGIRQATSALVVGFMAGDDQAVRTATRSLVTSCRM